MIRQVLQTLVTQKKVVESRAIANYRINEISEGVVGKIFEDIFVDVDIFEIIKTFEIDGINKNDNNANNFWG